MVSRRGRENNIGEHSTTWSPWDLLVAAAGIAALGLSQNESIGGTAQLILNTLGQVSLEYPILKALVTGAERRTNRRQRIVEGMESFEPIGEQVLVLGGTGHPTIDDLFNAGVFNILPAFNTDEAARSLEGIVRPAYINLGLGESTENMYTSEGFAVAKIRGANLFHKNLSSVSSEKIPVFATFAFAETIADTMSHNGPSVISLARQEAGHTAWQEVVKDMLGGEQQLVSNASIMVRFGDAYKPIKDNKSIGGVVLRDLVERRGSSISYNEGRTTVIIDDAALVTWALKRMSADLASAVFGIQTSIPGLTKIPFLKTFRLMDADSPGSNTNMYNPVTLILESDDEETISTASRRRNLYRGRDDSVLLLETAEAAVTAGQMGFERIICMSDLHEEMMLKIVGWVKEGKTAMHIQELVDKDLNAKDCRAEILTQGMI